MRHQTRNELTTNMLRTCETYVVYHVPKYGWNVNEKIDFVSPNENVFREKVDFLKGRPKLPNGISE